MPALEESEVQDTESTPSDDEEETQRTVLGDSFITNRREQRIANHPYPSTMAGTRSGAKGGKAGSKRKAEDDDSEATLSKDEQKDLQLKRMEMEVARLKTREKLKDSHKSGRKSKDNSTDSATKGLVWDITREQFFSICKFVSNDDQLLKATENVMNRIDIEQFRGLDGPKLAKAQEVWVQKHKNTVRNAMNNYRNYIQHQMQQKFKDMFKKPNFKVEHVPSAEEILNVAQRMSLTDQDPNPDRARWVFDFYWDILVPVVASHKRWGSGKRYQCLMSTARPGGDPDAELFVTPSDEAYTVVAWENYIDVWLDKWEKAQSNSKAGPTNPEDKDADATADAGDPNKAGGGTTKQTSKTKKKAGKKKAGEDDDEEEEKEEEEVEVVLPRFTLPNGGVQEFGGWNKAGRKRYREVLDLIKKSKGLACTLSNKTKFKASKSQAKHVEAVEQEALARLRAANNINEGKKCRKPNPAARPNEDLDSDHEPDWL